MAILVHQRDHPSAFELGLDQLAAHSIERERSHQNADWFPGRVLDRNYNGSHQLMRLNRRLIYARDVWPPLTGGALIPLTVGKVLIEQRLGGINGAHRAIEVVHADECEIRPQDASLLQM